ncbi:MAG: BspA family leucine-rich repeat surface protein [Oscillospiraceae bacterium]|nr:BspA family leucine-rich repeat surface protein [Candidatus Limimonas egerieequi]
MLTIKYTTTQSSTEVTATYETINELKLEITQNSTYKTILKTVVLSGGVDLDESAEKLFYQCSSIISIDASGFDTHNITNMRDMFSKCTSVKSINIDNYVTSSVTTMNGMFNSCESLTTLNVLHFDTSNVTNTAYMFYGCNALTSLDVSSFDTSKVTDMQSMFAYCSSLRELDLRNFDTSNVTNMHSMFRYCSSISKLNLKSFNTSKVTDFGYFMPDCISLTEVDLTSFTFNVATDVSVFFYNSSNLETIVCPNNWNSMVPSSATKWGLFTGCTSLRGAIAYDSSKTDVTYANPSTGYFTSYKVYCNDSPCTAIKYNGTSVAHLYYNDRKLY